MQQHILSTQPYLMLPTKLEQSLHLDHTQLDDFSQGYISGSNEAYSEREDGEAVGTEQDLWAFVSRQCSPKILASERILDQALGETSTPLAYRAGYMAGYLHTMFASGPDQDVPEGENTHA